MSNYNNNKKYGLNNTSYYSTKITQNSKKSPVEYYEIKIVGIGPENSRKFPPIGRQI